MDTLLRDIRYALRTWLREPGFTLLALLALTLGTGATTAIFTVVDSVLLRPLQYRDPARLVVALHGPTATNPVSPADYFDYRGGSRSFEHLGAAQAFGATLGGGERPIRVAGLQVSADLFDLLGVAPSAGRTFVAGEDQPGRNHIVVLSDALWRHSLGADRSIVGRAVQLDGEPYVVVGIMPPAFHFAPFWITRAEFWTPIALAPRVNDRGGRSLRLFGRLKPGVTVAQAQSEMSAIASRLEREHPDTNAGITITIRPLLDKVVSGIRPTLLALMAMVVFVLLIACANVANTLLARASGRQQEMALRAAIGASRGRVLRQLLTESIVLAAAGTAAGLVAAVWGIRWLLAMLPPGSLPRQQDVTFSAAVFAAAAVATLATGVGTGLVPAFQLLRTSLTSVFQDGGKGATEAFGPKRVRRLLVAAEVALALVLLTGAGLMARTMLNLSAIDPGFRVDGIAVATISLTGTPAAASDARQPMFLRIREQLSAIPGVSSVSAINHLPVAGDMWTLGYSVDGQAPGPGRSPSAAYRIVEPGYVRTMGLRLLAGRDITDEDGAASLPVAVINQRMADRQWPGGSAIGRRIYLPGVSNVQTPITIVGVAANAIQQDWTGAPIDEVYLPYAQRAEEFGLSSMTFVLRTNIDAEGVAAVIPREVGLVDRGAAVSDSTTMTQVVADALWRDRLMTALTGIFGAIALGLAAIGVYAVVAYSVARRRREFGVRLALGATRRDVLHLAVGEAIGPVLIGGGAGVILAIAGARLGQSLLFEVNAIDPVTLGGSALTLLIVAILAAWLPAYRASRLSPTRALSQD